MSWRLTCRRQNFVNLHGSMCSTIDPDEGVSPLVGKLYFDQMMAFGASWSVSLEDGVRAPAAAIHTFEDQVSTLIMCHSRWAASFAEGSHSLCDYCTNSVHIRKRDERKFSLKLELVLLSCCAGFEAETILDSYLIGKLSHVETKYLSQLIQVELLAFRNLAGSDISEELPLPF